MVPTRTSMSVITFIRQYIGILTPSSRRSDYIPPSRPYELANLTLDLILLARWILVPKGRLVFFLPTVNEDYDEIDIPKVEGMRELKIGDGSVQDFGKWGRRVCDVSFVISISEHCTNGLR